MEKKVVFRLDTEKIKRLKMKAIKEETTLKDLFNKAVDLLLLKDKQEQK